MNVMIYLQQLPIGENIMALKGSEQALRTKYIHIQQQLNNALKHITLLTQKSTPTPHDVSRLTYYIKQAKAKSSFLEHLDQLMVRAQQKGKQNGRRETNKEGQANSN